MYKKVKCITFGGTKATPCSPSVASMDTDMPLKVFRAKYGVSFASTEYHFKELDIIKGEHINR